MTTRDIQKMNNLIDKYAMTERFCILKRHIKGAKDLVNGTKLTVTGIFNKIPLP